MADDLDLDQLGRTCSVCGAPLRWHDYIDSDGDDNMGLVCSQDIDHEVEVDDAEAHDEGHSG